MLPGRRVDYDDELLAELDWVVASVHTSFGMSEADMTARMVAAIEHPYVDVIGHPTGRKIETARAVRRRHRAGDRGRGAHAHDARDQRGARPARPQRDPRPRRRRGRRADRGRLRRALGPQPRPDALRHRHRAARVAHAGAGREHAPVGRSWTSCASGAAPRHERAVPRRPARRRCRSRSPAALLAASFGVLARDVGMPGWAAIVMSVIVFAGLGADRGADDHRRGRRARRRDRRRGADELALPADGDRDRAVAAGRAGRARGAGADGRRRVVGAGVRRRGRLRPPRAVRLDARPVRRAG